MKRYPSGRPWQRVRKVVFQMHGHTCHLCGHEGAGQVDHVISVKEAPELAWSLSNLRPAHGTGNRCPTCGKCCNQARLAGPKRPVLSSVPVAPQLSGTVPHPATRASRQW